MNIDEYYRLFLPMTPGIWTAEDWMYRQIFLQQNPPEYDGKKKCVLAEGWCLCMEEIFND